ncbi:MAG: hypothetical protein ACLQU3_19720 [Limisphaerales bacterium]
MIRASNFTLHWTGSSRVSMVSMASALAAAPGQKGVKPEICRKSGWRLGGVGTFGVVACVQELAVTPGELLADADLIHSTTGASDKHEEEAIHKAVDFCTTARRQTVDWSSVPCEARFWDWKFGSAKPHYL